MKKTQQSLVYRRNGAGNVYSFLGFTHDRNCSYRVHFRHL